MTEPISFTERLKELQEKKARERGEPLPFQPPQQFDPQLIPNVDQGRERSDEDREMDRIIDSIDILTAYNKWCGKTKPNPGNKRESIKVGCPNPGHPDNDPSAWLNLDKNVYMCEPCGYGGDVYDIAALHYGYPVPGYKEGTLFHKLREQMAEDFGYRVKHVAGGKVIYQEVPESETSPESGPGGISPGNAGLDTAGIVDSGSPASPGESTIPATETQGSDTPSESDTSDDTGQWSKVTPLYADDDEPELVLYPHIDWREFVPKNTFLWHYMEACSNDDSPEEYHFWHGLIALGHAVGRKVTLDDSRPVYGNLLLCLLGATGTGKSRSRGWLDTVIKQVMPYKEDGMTTTGVKIVPVPSSGEYLVSAFSYEGKDPTNPRSSLGFQPVNGIVDFDELSALLARANRQGSTMKPTIMGLADARDEVKIGGLQRGDFVAHSPFCSITASTQPKAIRTLLNKTDTGSGFLNRWVFAGGPPKEREVIGGSHSSRVIDLDAAVESLKKVHGYGGVSRAITLEPDALGMLQTFYTKQVFPLQERDQSDLLKRLDLLFKKLILLFCINERRTTAGAPQVAMAIKLWEYVVECYGILNENIGVTHSQEIVNEILRHIKRHQEKTGRGASARDIARYTARKNYSPEQIKRALEVMVALDWIDLEKSKGVGRPTVRYQAIGNLE